MQGKPDRYQDIRDAVRSLCAAFPDEYHRDIDTRRAYPEKFVDALTEAGWLAALIPTEYGGSGLGLAEATVIMEEINRSGGNAGACHGQMYNMGTLLRHGSAAQKQHSLPKIASGEWRLQSMGVTEPTSGTDTTALQRLLLRPEGSLPGMTRARVLAMNSLSRSRPELANAAAFSCSVDTRTKNPWVDRCLTEEKRSL